MFFRRKTKPNSTSARRSEDSQCNHAALAPRWESAADMGNAAKVTSCECATCHARFSRDEGEHLIELHAARTRESLGGPRSR